MNTPQTAPALPELYRFIAPYPGEESARFIVLEKNGNRWLCQEVYVSRNQPIQPTAVYMADELIKA